MDKKKIEWKTLIISVLIPLAVGGLSALLTMGSMEHFGMLGQPPLSPPAMLFPIVWTILYTLMGIASYLVIESSVSIEQKASALKPYFVQLAFNFFWSILFFNLEVYEISFAWLLALLALIVITAVRFAKINKWAGILMIPYILWVAFAGYLNAGIAVLN